MRGTIVFLILSFCLLQGFHGGSPGSRVQGVTGGSAVLPCNTSSPVEGSYPTLVMWFKDASLDPFYSYDARPVPPGGVGGQHWADSTVEGRVAFTLGGRGGGSRSPGTSSLTVLRVQEGDTGLYRCRVDFQQAPTQHSQVNLYTIVPPSSPRLVDESGLSVGPTIGPYYEGEEARVHCEVQGGQPAPTISWTRNGQPAKAATEVSRGQVVTSSLLLPPLRRSESNQTICCTVSNSPLVPTMVATTTLLLYLAPLGVSIANKQRKLLANKLYMFTCTAKDYSPEVEFSWFLGDSLTPMDNSDKTGGTSTLKFSPTIKDHRAALRCQAYSPLLPLQSLQDSLLLHIYYKPEIELNLGHGVNASDIREGGDVYLDCRVTSRPHTDNIIWLKDGGEVKQNKSVGRLVSSRSLVLQNISRLASGDYSCRAENSEGRTTSHGIKIIVKYAPICSNSSPSVLGVGEGEELLVPCNVQAHPKDMLEFRWTFNSSSESPEFLSLPPSQYSSKEDLPGSSILRFHVLSERDYGTLECTASNQLGPAVQPCIFTILLAEGPNKPQGCQVTGTTPTSASVVCSHSVSSPVLATTFTLELYHDSQLTNLLRNTSRSVPRFQLTRLTPGHLYTARVYSTTRQGRSQPVIVGIGTQEESSRFLILPKDDNLVGYPEDRTVEGSSDISLGFPLYVRMILGSFLLFALILIVFSASVGAICRIQCRLVEAPSEIPVVQTHSTATSPIVGGGVEFDGSQGGSMNLLLLPSLSPRARQGSCHSLAFSSGHSLSTDNLSFSSYEVLDPGPEPSSYQTLVVRPGNPSYPANSTSQEHLAVEPGHPQYQVLSSSRERLDYPTLLLKHGRPSYLAQSTSQEYLNYPPGYPPHHPPLQANLPHYMAFTTASPTSMGSSTLPHRQRLGSVDEGRGKGAERTMERQRSVTFAQFEEIGEGRGEHEEEEEDAEDEEEVDEAEDEDDLSEESRV